MLNEGLISYRNVSKADRSRRGNRITADRPTIVSIQTRDPCKVTAASRTRAGAGYNRPGSAVIMFDQCLIMVAGIIRTDGPAVVRAHARDLDQIIIERAWARAGHNVPLAK